MSGNPTNTCHALSRTRFFHLFLFELEYTVDNTTLVKPVETNSTIELITKISQDAQQVVGTIMGNLITERKAWEHQEFTRSNDRLYGILQSCYSLYKSMNSVSAEAMSLKKGFNEFCKQQNWTFKDSTHLLVKIVRCVFGDDRRRVSSYATALRGAAEQNISVLDIPTFFKEQGGVEQVRRKKSDNYQSPKEKAVIGMTAMEGEVLAEFHSDKLAARFSASDYNGAVILMATREPSGSFAVRRLIQNGSAITAALSSLSSVVKTEKAKKEPEVKAANDANMRETAIEQAVNA